MIRCSWHGASCPREILRFSTVSSPEVQKRRGADVDFQAAWAHVSNQEHQISPRGASDRWRESVRKSVSVSANRQWSRRRVSQSTTARSELPRRGCWRPSRWALAYPTLCERVVHEVGAELMHRPSAVLLQLDFRNAFNLASMPAAVAYLSRAFPLLRPHVESVYLGATAPSVYVWVDGVYAADAAANTPARLWLEVQRGVQQGDPLGLLLHAAAMHLAVLRLAAAHPSAVVRAVHNDVVVVASLKNMPAVLTTAAAAGAAVDAELAPAKCSGCSPAGAPAPAGWPARWHADGVRQFSIPLGTDGFVSSAVDTLAAVHRRMTVAIVGRPRGELQSQLLLLRLCACPQPNYWLQALPLVWGARLAASVDRADQGAVRCFLTDARDAPAVVDTLLTRAALPLSHGGLGIEGRTAIVPAAALASRVDALRAGRQYSPGAFESAIFMESEYNPLPLTCTRI